MVVPETYPAMNASRCRVLVLFLYLCLQIACSQTGDTRQKGNMNKLAIGDPVPVFALKNQDGKLFDVRDYIGTQILIIYFYPKDESPVCTKQACALRDSYEAFTDANAMVIGINSGSVESHKAFIDNHRLPFTLLSDPDNNVLKSFGVKGFLFLTGRETFVVDIDGKIGYKFSGMLKGKEHAEKVLGYLKGD